MRQVKARTLVKSASTPGIGTQDGLAPPCIEVLNAIRLFNVNLKKLYGSL